MLMANLGLLTIGRVGLPDPFYSNVSLLAYLDGASGANNFIDQKGKILTPYGNATQSGGKGVFDGVGDYLTVPYSADFDFGTAGMTLEYYITHPGNNTSRTICADWTTGGSPGPSSWIMIIQGTTLTVYANAGNHYDATTDKFVTSVTLPANVRTHVAMSQGGNTFRLFINGNVAYTTAFGGFGTGHTNPISIVGYAPSGAADSQFMGSMDNFRITKGVNRYTTDTFTPPSTPFPNF